MQDTVTILKSLDRRIRASTEYADWVRLHKSSCCLNCNSAYELEVHHLVDLYHIILGLWKFYGDEEEVFKHAVSWHAEDKVGDGVTLCKTCHTTRHPGRILSATHAQVNTSIWSVIPRMHGLSFNHSTVERTGSVGLIGLQSFIGIGWYVLNGHVESRILTIHRRRFAELVGKKAGTSFDRSLETALEQLQAASMLYAWHRQGNDIELHLSSEYLDMLASNPWFVPMSDLATGSMCALTLRLFLGMQSRRHHYAIGLDKLKMHLGMSIQHKTKAIEAIQRAMKQVGWAKMEVNSSLRFTINSRPPTPIRSLRAILSDSLEQAR